MDFNIESRFTQNFLAGKNSVKSVDSVGDIRALTSVRICEICGSFFNYKLRAVSQGLEHEKINLFLLICSPTDFSFWWEILPQISQIYTELSCWKKICEICGFCGRYTHPNICENLLSMLKSKCFDHYFHFKLRFYIQGWMFGDF